MFLFVVHMQVEARNCLVRYDGEFLQYERMAYTVREGGRGKGERGETVNGNRGRGSERVGVKGEWE